MPLPYRLNVGAVLFGPDGRVFVGRRAGFAGAWQLPQGGIDKGEDPRAAVLRELLEEVGTDKAEIIGEHPDWLTYDLPPELVGVAWHGKYQ
jgi:putative (di)nucleoside polyphosphate hydrolase